jgi:hypothetical protein
VHRVVVPQSVGALIRRGIRVLASCSIRCKLIVNVDVGSGVANQLGLIKTRIARGTASTAAGKRRWVTARLTSAAATALRTYGGGGRLHIGVRAIGPAAESAPNPRNCAVNYGSTRSRGFLVSTVWRHL